MNPFLHGFTATKLISYVQSLQATVRDRKRTPTQRMKSRNELYDARDALQAIIADLARFPQSPQLWAKQHGLPVKVPQTGAIGVISDRGEPHNEMVVVNFPDGSSGSYYPQEIEISLPKGIWEFPT